MYLIGNGNVLTWDKALPIVSAGGVVTDGSFILDIDKTKTLKLKYPEAEFIDAAGGVIMPGLINAHTHCYSLLAAGLCLPKSNKLNRYDPLHDVRSVLDGKLEFGMIGLAAAATVINNVKCGVTTFFDQLSCCTQPSGSLMTIASIVKNYGVRACLSYEVNGCGRREDREAAITENFDFSEYIDSLRSDKLKAMFGLRPSAAFSDKTLERCAAKCGGHGFHIDASEEIFDIYAPGRGNEPSRFARLYSMGILNDKTLLTHCDGLDEETLDVISDAGCMLVKTPRTSLLDTMGSVGIAEMIKRGSTPGIGTDARLSDPIEISRQIICENAFTRERISTGEAAAMLFEENRAIASRVFGIELGILKPGAAADIIILDYIPYTPISCENADEHILFGTGGRDCTFCMIDGKIIMRERRLLFADETAIKKDLYKLTSQLWKELHIK